MKRRKKKKTRYNRRRSKRSYRRRYRRNSGRPTAHQIEKVTFEFYKMRQYYPGWSRESRVEEIAAKFRMSIPMVRSIVASIPHDKSEKKNPSADEGPNLDGMWADDLMAFWKKHQGGRHASEVFPSKRSGYKTATAALANYAANKATAMKQREKGHIQDALRYEDICDRIYKTLPSFARW